MGFGTARVCRLSERKAPARSLRDRIHGLRIVLGLVATLFASIPEMPAHVWAPLAPGLSDHQPQDTAAILFRALVRAAEEREEAVDDAPFEGPGRIALLDSREIRTSVSRSPHATSYRFSRSHFPTGPPEA